MPNVPPARVGHEAHLWMIVRLKLKPSYLCPRLVLPCFPHDPCADSYEAGESHITLGVRSNEAELPSPVNALLCVHGWSMNPVNALLCVHDWSMKLANLTSPRVFAIRMDGAPVSRACTLSGLESILAFPSRSSCGIMQHRVQKVHSGLMDMSL